MNTFARISLFFPYPFYNKFLPKKILLSLERSFKFSRFFDQKCSVFGKRIIRWRTSSQLLSAPSLYSLSLTKFSFPLGFLPMLEYRSPVVLVSKLHFP